MEVDHGDDAFSGKITIERVIVVNVFCGRDVDKKSGLCCCAQQKISFPGGTTSSRIRRVFRATLRNRDWVFTKRYGWICRECAEEMS